MLATLRVISLVVSFVNSTTMLLKCCDNRYILDNSLNCIKNSSNGKMIPELSNDVGITITSICSINKLEMLSNFKDYANNSLCMDKFDNGSSVILLCLGTDNETINNQCDSIVTVLNFWGASMVVLATILYTISYVIVVIVYCFLPKNQNSAYDRSVISFNVSYIVLNTLIIFSGYFELCHIELTNTTYGILGLIIVYFIQACCLWLFIICFDMTLAITRFHWIPIYLDRRDGRNEFRKYAAATWFASTVPTIIAAVMEFNSVLPHESSLRPNFSDFHGQHNIAILFYTLFLPVVMLLTNTCLFFDTTYKIIKIQRDEKILNKNRSKVKKAKKRYIVYLKLYLIMNASWLSGALSAVFPSLWFLKFVRILQLILMLIVIVPRQRMIQAYDCLRNTLTKCSACFRGDVAKSIYKKKINILLEFNRSINC
ncbi:uncharacterized protein [Chelonus insularis]|uniref:uncharacterized protein n=1 Tax=Chelonus insularis TaxID=460826 RepID=UPI00158D2041|nr:uncharacterized protein LOC118071173 [Chelonus insularis]